jgi:sugar lactone lactonase YvrE
MTTGTGGNGGHAGNGGAPPGKLSSATPISTDVAYALAFDATLSNDGAIVYFTGVGPNGVGVFSAPTSGGAPQEIAAGAAFGAPFGIALSTDGKKLFVADPGASGTALDGGRILTVDPEQGTVTPVAGTEDALPRGLEVGQANGKDQLYFTGTVKGVAGIYKIPAAGGTITTLAQGMDDPSGIAVTKAGTVYLIDTTGSPTRHASVLTFDGNALTTFYPEIAVGYPAGIALSHDEKTLIISTLEPKKGASSLLLLDILSKEPTRFPGDASLDGLSEPGGLHRARDQQQLAWVSYNPKGGSVLLVK